MATGDGFGDGTGRGPAVKDVLVVSGKETLGVQDREHVWSKDPRETSLHYLKRLCTEGDSIPDAFLSIAAAQIGQIMLSCPHALWSTGVAFGLIWSAVIAVISFWTMYLLVVLFLERKRDLIKAGNWYDDNGKRVKASQYHDVIRHHLGRAAGILAQVLIALGLMAVGIAQVVASSGNTYNINKSQSKRTYSLIWGLILMLFAFVPTFRHFRVLNIIALVGTAYTAIYIVVTSATNGLSPQLTRWWPEDMQEWFNGAAILSDAIGSHVIALEMMDAMKVSGAFVGAYAFGWGYTIFVVIPHSLMVNLGFPDIIPDNDNVYGALPLTDAKRVSVALMLIHQFVAFALYTTPLFFMWEKLIGTHTRRLSIRLVSRIPLALFIWFVGVAIPFYGVINSLLGAIATPGTSFVFPCIAFNVVYWKKSRRDVMLLPPTRLVRWVGWWSLFIVNWILAVIFTFFGVTAVVFAVKGIVERSNTFGVFPECYQCN